MKTGWLLAGLVGLAGCGSIDVSQYAAQTPTLDLRTYFDGTIDAHGMFQDRSGEVVKRFTVRIDAQWEGDAGVLDEHFVYSDGTTQRRVWHIDYLGDGRYEGRADDVVGVATGHAAGNALHWRYVLALPVGERTVEVVFDDWMFLVDERVMLNRSEMRKFGFRLGEVTLSFTRREGPGGAQSAHP
ncbi:MAG: DUF3833 domain-containing protein [Rhodocyclaceae bacterium]|nr:DUF3833 domain-containing protein [Rhodocyclaceae bacterium]